MTKRVWKELEDYPGYEISTLGELRRAGSETNLKPYDDGRGYRKFDFKRNGKRKSAKMHQLVLKTFGPPQPSSKHVPDHLNRNKADNRIDNLEWKTQSDNVRNVGVKPSKSGFTYIYPRGRSFQILKMRDGKLVHLGMIDTIGL